MEQRENANGGAQRTTEELLWYTRAFRREIIVQFKAQSNVNSVWLHVHAHLEEYET